MKVWFHAWVNPLSSVVWKCWGVWLRAAPQTNLKCQSLRMSQPKLTHLTRCMTPMRLAPSLSLFSSFPLSLISCLPWDEKSVVFFVVSASRSWIVLVLRSLQEVRVCIGVKAGQRRWPAGYQPDMICRLGCLESGEPPPPITSICLNSFMQL